MSVNNLFLKSGYVNTPLANGCGRFILQCQRITIKFCKAFGSSRGTREFIEHDLIDFARSNPSVVTYVKPRRHRSPVIVAEYLNGHREWMCLANMQREEVAKWVEHMKTMGGQGEMRYKLMQRTDNPTIQGVWNPVTHKDPMKNVAQFPNEEYAKTPNRQKTATEILLEMYGNNKNQPQKQEQHNSSQ